jgi:hypothetical protein
VPLVPPIARKCPADTLVVPASAAWVSWDVQIIPYIVFVPFVAVVLEVFILNPVRVLLLVLASVLS